MSTCDRCIAERHLRCRRGDCSCSVCAEEGKVGRAQFARRPIRKPAFRRPPVPAKRRIDTRRRFGTSQVARNIQEFGFSSELPREDILKIQDLRHRGVAISAAAREVGTTRDKVRTIYKHTRIQPMKSSQSTHDACAALKVVIDDATRIIQTFQTTLQQAVAALKGAEAVVSEPETLSFLRPEGSEVGQPPS